MNYSNLLLTREFKLDVVKIADLGISKYIVGSTVPDTYCGTKQYMSPEQSRGIDLRKHTETYEIHSYTTDVW